MLVIGLVHAASAQPAQSPSHPDEQSAISRHAALAELHETEAEYEKLTAEAHKLERDNSWLSRALSYLAPFLTAIAAAGGVFVSVWKVGRDRRDAIDREERQRADTRGAAEVERFDERFAKAVAGLSSSTPGEQSGAAVMVASMVREKSDDLSSQALQLLLVALQSSHDEACERLLRFALERFARAAPHRLVAKEDSEPVTGLVHVRAPRLNLANLELPGLDIAFAFLREADFRRADLRASKGYETNLDESILDGADLTEAAWAKVYAERASFRRATLASATLRGAKLNGANFFRADLRRVNLAHAELPGARFEKALLKGANFSGAQLDERALDSIQGLSDWRQARFDKKHRLRLDELERASEADAEHS